MSDAIFYVYALFRPWDGSPFYIGKGKAERWLDHQRPSTKHTNKHLANIIKKAAGLGLEIPRVKIRENLFEAEAFSIERALIAAIGRGRNGPLVNATDGGEGSSGNRLSEQARDRIRQSAMGNTRSLGAVRSQETIQKLRAKRNSAETRAKMSASHKGKVLSAEHRMKLSLAKKGRTLSPTVVAKIQRSRAGYRHSIETLAKMGSALERCPISGRWKSRIDVD